MIVKLDFAKSNTPTLGQCYPTYEDFKDSFDTLQLNYIPFKNESFLRHIYIVLMGEYMTSPIKSYSPEQFEIKLMTIVADRGPEYERLLDIQKDLLSMSPEDLSLAQEAIYNTALNPAKSLTKDDEIIRTVNQQNTTRQKRGKLNAYAALTELMDSNITKRFLKYFDHLFKTVLTGTEVLYFTEEGSLDL